MGNYQPTNQKGERGRPTTVGFGNNCAPYPRTDLLDQKNPTCDVRTYVGGQIACHHMFSLLDADQDIPWPDQPLEYHLKMRFWYQDYDEAYHTNGQHGELLRQWNMMCQSAQRMFKVALKMGTGIG